MGLSQYKQKRNFKKTPEPTGGKTGKDQHAFVIQKHAASHLHYDFRLEMDGVLKSWAVPKGPSTDPAKKRLAMMVEDHPFDYRNFEGIIPEGYGAGTVIVWDQGTYQLNGENSKNKKADDKALLKSLAEGKLHILLKGKKLQGEFVLTRTRNSDGKQWLLIKVKDKFVSKKDILKDDRSVISNKTLEQIAAKRTVTKKEKQNKTKTKNKKQIKIPAYKPMLATLVDGTFEEEGWKYEVKWDGYRALAVLRNQQVELYSRNDKSFTEKFYPVCEALKEYNFDAVLDGEIVVLNKSGFSDFGQLQNWRSEADGELVYYVFDLLWYNGKDFAKHSLEKRREILDPLISGNGTIRLSEQFSGNMRHFFETAKETGLEGILVKKNESQYHSGARSKEWLKIKSGKRQEVVIGGYTVNEDTSKPFSALLAGVYNKGKLEYIGKIGTGFGVSLQKDLLTRFHKLQSKKSPFSRIPDVNKPSRFRPEPPTARAFWLKPKLVAEVSFTELTSDGLMRHPSFKGLREDKAAKDVVLEKEKTISNKMPKTNKNKLPGLTSKAERKSLLNPNEETQTKKINGHEIKFTNLSKIFWPDENIRKRDVLNYYYQIAPFILPYLKDRPQSLNRHPNGIQGKSFYQKDVTGKAPDWIKTLPYHSEGESQEKNFLVCTNEASLLYMASLGCIEMNPWHSKVSSPDHPDWCIIDLDPGRTTFEQVIVAARETKKVLDELGIEGYPKTSGSTGIHIYIPLAAKCTYDQSKEFARIIARLVHERIPDFTSIERIVRNRKGKMYLDFLQNRPQATVSAPYSLRPKPGATVSTPLHWDEVKKGLKMKDFNIRNTVSRLKNTGDLFAPVLKKGVNLRRLLKQIED